MRSRVGLWGGSCAIRLPKMAVETLRLTEGDDVRLDIIGGQLVISPSKPSYRLEDLVEQAKGLEPPESCDDGRMGEEVL